MNDAEDGGALMEIADASLAIGLSRAEIDTQISTARRFPRNLTQVRARLLSLVTLDDETAEECMYALPRGGKPIKGPSIRFAESLQSAYGNCRTASRVVFVDRVERVVIAEGIFHDLETNAAKRAEVRRRITDKKGRLFNDDMIVMTGNAAGSIALRNAILGGIPKAVWRAAYGEVLSVIAGDVKTLSENRGKALKAFAQFGITPDQVFGALGVAGDLDITLDLMPTLRGMYATLKNGESTVEEMFGGGKAKSTHETVRDPLADKVDEETGEIAPAAPAMGASATEEAIAPIIAATIAAMPPAMRAAHETNEPATALPQPVAETAEPTPSLSAPATRAASPSPIPTPLPMMTDLEFGRHVDQTLERCQTADEAAKVTPAIEDEIRRRGKDSRDGAFLAGQILAAHKRWIAAELTTEQAAPMVEKALAKLVEREGKAA
jgi:hypothetical protein